MESIIWQTMYIVSAWCALIITFLFYKTHNGSLRKALMFFFASLSWGLFWRALIGYGISPFSPATTSAIIIIPLFISLSGLTFYLFERYK